MSTNKTSLFLYLKTGGGHLAPADAISNWISQNTQNKAIIELHDGFLGTTKALRKVVEDGYRFSQAKGKWMFELLYALHKIKPLARVLSWIITKFVSPALERKIIETNPEKIIIFHFFLIKPTINVLKKHNINTPIIVVVTDPFTAHPIWFLERNLHFIVFSNKLKTFMVKRYRVSPNKVTVFPFTLNSKYSRPATIQKQLAIRAYLEINPNSKVILLMGGADGLPKGDLLLKHLAKTEIDAEIIVVCGKNVSLKRKAHKIRHNFQLTNLHVLGFVNFVYELISISDVVITKCGASTFMEVLMCGKIPLVNSYIWEQEKGNVEFISQNGMGVFEPNIKRIAEIAEMLIKDDDIKSIFLQNIQRMQFTNGTPYVSKFIQEYNNSKNEYTSNFRLAY